MAAPFIRRIGTPSPTRCRCAGLLCLLVACTPFHFRDGELAAKEAMRPRNLVAVYSSNEDLTAVFWTFDAAPAPELGTVELLVAGEPIDVAPLAVPATAVAQAHAVGLLLPGRPTGLQLRLTYVRPYQQELLDIPEQTGTLGFAARFADDNTTVSIWLDDPLAKMAGGAIHRALRGELRTPDCHSTVERFDLQAHLNLVAPPSPLSADGEYCVVVASERASLSAQVSTHVELRRVEHLFVPPVHHSPVIILPVFDLELPQDGRCAEVEQNLLEQFADASAGVAADARILSPVELAAGPDGTRQCLRVPDPVLDLSVVQARLGDELAPGPERAVLLVYVNNIEAPLGFRLGQSFEATVAWAASRGGALFPSAIGTQSASESYPFTWVEAWTYAVDPALGERVEALVEATVPVWRTTHLPGSFVPFFARGQGIGGFGYKVCAINRAVVIYEQGSAPYIPLPPSGVAGYWVSLPSEYLPAHDSGSLTVTATLEVCRAFCDRDGPEAWAKRVGCVP